MSDTGTTTRPKGAAAEAEAVKRAQRRQELTDRKQAILLEWEKGAQQGSAERYADLEEAARWQGDEASTWNPLDVVNTGLEVVNQIDRWATAKADDQPNLNATEGDLRKQFAREQIPGGRKRQEVIDEYKAIKKEIEEIDAKTTEMGFDQDAQNQLLADMKQESNEASIWLRAKRLIPIVTDKELEDYARTGTLDLTPAGIADMYLQVKKDPKTGEPGLMPDPGAFTDPMSGANVRFDRADMDLEAELRKLREDVEAYATPAKDRGSLPGSGGVGMRGAPGATLAQRRRDLMKEPLSAGPKSLREAFARPYRMSKDQLSSLGVALFEAGYLEVASWDPKKPLSVQTALGDPYNPEFQKAYQRWMLDTFRDRTKSATEILEERKKANKPVFDNIAAEMAKEKAKRLAQVTRLSDPLALRQAAESFAKQILGREFISEAEINSLIGMVHGQQTAYGQQVVAAEEAGTGPTAITEVDPEAQLRAALEANHPVEAEAYATAGQYENFLSMIGAAGGRI